MALPAGDGRGLQSFVNSFTRGLSGTLNNFASAQQNSALSAERQASAEANAFNASQAALNRQFQQSSAERAMQFESSQAQLNRDFQERMSNTSYQRAVEDLRKAGLNPILAYQQGGASMPSGSSASSSMASGATASGFKSNSASAVQTDYSTLVPMIVVQGLTSALKDTKLPELLSSFAGKVDYVVEGPIRRFFNKFLSAYKSANKK